MSRIKFVMEIEEEEKFIYEVGDYDPWQSSSGDSTSGGPQDTPLSSTEEDRATGFYGA